MKDVCNTCGEEVVIGLLVKNRNQAKGYLNLCKKCKRSKSASNRDPGRKTPRKYPKKQSDYGGEWLGSDAVYL